MLTDEFKEVARDYVRDLVIAHAFDIENLTVWETAHEWPGMPTTRNEYEAETLTDEQYEYIFNLLADVEITVELPC